MAFFNYSRFNDCMDEGERPPVYVVDTHASRPPLPPRLNYKPKHSGRTQTLLFLLVGLALCGLFVEAVFIYYFHQSHDAPSPVSHKQTGDKAVSKPLAHMTGGHGDDNDNHIMVWNMNADPILKEIGYKDGRLIIKRDGYYYVYSKVFFRDSGIFYHSVQMHTRRYGLPLNLLQYMKHSPQSNVAKSNSFLGGVFYFERNDTVCVNVNDTKKIIWHRDEENVFGAYMISEAM